MWWCGKPGQWRTVEIFLTLTLPRNIRELTACHRAEQIPCICFKLKGHWSCLQVVCLWYDSGIISLSMHLSLYMGIFRTIQDEIGLDRILEYWAKHGQSDNM